MPTFSFDDCRHTLMLPMASLRPSFRHAFEIILPPRQIRYVSFAADIATPDTPLMPPLARRRHYAAMMAVTLRGAFAASAR